MFQTPPDQLPHWALREKYCCCEPEVTWPSILLSARKPPLELPESASATGPRTWTRRSAAPWETAHISIWPAGGAMVRFSHARQKLSVAFPELLPDERTVPLMTTS